MEQKLPIHHYAGQNMPAMFWPQMAMSPFWWGEDHPFAAMQRNMNRMFGDVLDDFKMASPLMSSHKMMSPDIREDRKSFCVKMAVPGLEADDIDISADDGMLTIMAEKNEKKKNMESSYSFSQSVSLPEGADINRADVTLSNNMLTIDIPKMDNGSQKMSIRNNGKQKQNQGHQQNETRK